MLINNLLIIGPGFITMIKWQLWLFFFALPQQGHSTLCRFGALA